MIVEQFFFLILIVFAFMTVQTSKLRRAVIFLAVFSASSAFVFLLLGAPDAALAEAIIGSTLSTIIYLATLQKYRVFSIYYHDDKKKTDQDAHISRKNNPVISLLEEFCFERELEPQIIYTVERLDKIKNRMGWDLIIRKKSNSIQLYGDGRNYHIAALKEHMEKNKETFHVEMHIE
ncbi:MAG: DUF4040 domain-containing protein [Clostridia bacterium]